MKTLFALILTALVASAQTNVITATQPDQTNFHVTNNCNGHIMVVDCSWSFTNKAGSFIFIAKTNGVPLLFSCHKTNDVNCLIFCLDDGRFFCGTNGEVMFVNATNEIHFSLTCATSFHISQNPLPVGTNVGFLP